MRRPVRLVRNIDANRLFDIFLLASVVTVLATRLYLHLTGYPQIGGDSVLHVAHLLPGGILMMCAILITIGTINRSSRDVAAFVGGIGFGLFWDELGKFITKDNDYFFQPAIGLIYLSFIVLYLITRYIIRRSYQPHDYLANALDLAMEGAIGELDPREYHRAQQLLLQADHNHPMYNAVAELLADAKPTRAYRPFITDRLLTALHRPFHAMVQKPLFKPLLIRFFVLFGICLLASLAVVSFWTSRQIFVFLASNPLHTTSIALLSGLVAASFIWWGLWVLRQGDAHKALRKFETALLIIVFVTQVFLFFSYQLSASIGLAIALPLLFSVRMLLSETR